MNSPNSLIFFVKVTRLFADLKIKWGHFFKVAPRGTETKSQGKNRSNSSRDKFWSIKIMLAASLGACGKKIGLKGDGSQSYFRTDFLPEISQKSLLHSKSGEKAISNG